MAVYLIEAGLAPLKLPRCCGGFCWLPVFLTVSFILVFCLGNVKIYRASR